MLCQMGYVKNHNQILVKELDFDKKTSNTKVIDIEHLSEQSLSILIYEPEQIEDQSLKELMVNDSKFYPIRSVKEIGINIDDFEKLEIHSAREILDKVVNSWVLQNNVTLLEEMFTVVDHLNSLWPNDRTAFFEELWFILKNNLGGKNVKLTYNDLKKIGKNEDKNTLIQVTVEGNKIPNPKEGQEFEKKLMQSYKEEFQNSFSVVEYSPSKGQLVIAGNIKKSPFLLMTNVNDFTKLQSSILKTFITALSR